jgi:hypothetical protein
MLHFVIVMRRVHLLSREEALSMLSFDPFALPDRIFRKRDTCSAQTDTFRGRRAAKRKAASS